MSVELLIVDKPGHPNFGEVVDIKPSPAVWGRRECQRQWVREGRNPSKFPGVHRSIRVDATVFEVQHYLEQWTELPAIIKAHDTGDRELIKPRRVLIEMGRLFNAGAITDPDGAPRVTKGQMKSLARNIKTNKLESEI